MRGAPPSTASPVTTQGYSGERSKGMHAELDKDLPALPESRFTGDEEGEASAPVLGFT